MRLAGGWSWVLSLFLTIGVGCGGGDDHESTAGSTVTPPPGGGSTPNGSTYGNGHSLSLDSTDPAILSVEDEMHVLCNNYRVSNGLNALIMDESQRSTARAHSRHMVEHDFFAHTNPEGDGPGARLTATGVSWSSAGENLAAGFPDAAAAFNGWLNSPGHRANIENAIWTHTGTGYWIDLNDDGIEVFFRYYTQVFTKP